MEAQKPVHTIVLDTGAIIRNHPTVSTLLAQSEQIVTVPAIISEIRDAATRSRVETTLQPFLTLRSPTPASIKFVTDFARKTGDLAVLSKPDVQIIALAYELECERNGGDWRLRKNPGQKGMNGSPPSKTETAPPAESKDGETQPGAEASAVEASTEEATIAETSPEEATTAETSTVEPDGETKTEVAQGETSEQPSAEASLDVPNIEETPVSNELSDDVAVQQISEDLSTTSLNSQPEAVAETNEESSDDDSEGWITPSNLKKHQAKDAGATAATTDTQVTLQVATLTTDFAMQNVLLQINLNLLSSNMQRVKHLKTYVLRCYACFLTTKEMTKQFCPRCGSPTLTRVACTTTSTGEFKLHLKKNMQWNTRGDRYSIPKAVHGSANGRVQGGGKGSWGNDLILTEDQKEYQRKMVSEGRKKEKDLMDEDYLPSILTGDRNKAGGRIKVGAGRNINSKKR